MEGEGMTYTEQLKDPRWQRKRLEIMERADFTCEDCDATDITLHIHHGYYEKGFAPWEYPQESLHCLCEACHEKAQARLTAIHRLIGALDDLDLDRVLGYLQGLAHDTTTPVVLPAPFVLEGFSQALGVPAREIYHAARGKGRISGPALQRLYRHHNPVIEPREG